MPWNMPWNMLWNTLWNMPWNNCTYLRITWVSRKFLWQASQTNSYTTQQLHNSHTTHHNRNTTVTQHIIIATQHNSHTTQHNHNTATTQQIHNTTTTQHTTTHKGLLLPAIPCSSPSQWSAWGSSTPSSCYQPWTDAAQQGWWLVVVVVVVLVVYQGFKPVLTQQLRKVKKNEIQGTIYSIDYWERGSHARGLYPTQDTSRMGTKFTSDFFFLNVTKLTSKLGFLNTRIFFVSLSSATAWSSVCGDMDSW